MKIIAIIIFIGLTSTAVAQVQTPRVDNRQTAQQARIRDGRMDGEVTRREAAALRHEQRHIRRSERRFEADGDVTRLERRRLERRQDRASRHIRRAKHNHADIG